MTYLIIASLVGLFVGLLIGMAFSPTFRAGSGGLSADLARSTDSLTEGLHHVFGQVETLRREWAESDGRLSAELRHSTQAARSLALTAETLQGALAAPKSRGQWGERMADDILRAAGFVEGINYERESTLSMGTRPDFTFPLPQNRCVHMDVKFPIDNYLRYLEASPEQKPTLAKAFANDVRSRVKELGDRGYTEGATTLDYIMLFIPNESVYGFIHEHDSGFVDFALARRVVPVSPTSLFAVLAIMRAAVDNFRLTEAGDQILASLGGLRTEWEKIGGSVAKMERAFQSARSALDELAGPRSRQFERQLVVLEELGGDHTDEHGPTLRQVI